MTRPLRFDDEAAGEVDAAADWYQLRGPTLAVEFIAEVRDGLARVASFPGLGPPAPGVATALGVRQRLLRRFPYAIVYVELVTEIRILALAHTSREPGYWRDRT